MASANISSSPSYIPSLNLDESNSAPDQTSVSSQKKMKEVINQSLIYSSSSDTIESNAPNEDTEELGMSSNVASKLSQLNLSNGTDFMESCPGTSPEDGTSNISKSRKVSEIKATSKQVFPNIACLPLENNIVFCYVLSVWDNIVGPQTIYVWKKKTKLKLVETGKLQKQRNGKKYADKPSFGNATLPRNSTSKPNTSVKYKKTLLRSQSVGGKDLLNKEKAGWPENELQTSSNVRRLCLPTVVKYVTEHTVGVGEVGQWKANKMVAFLLNVPHQDIIVLSIRFHVIEDGVGVPYCLSAVIPSQAESLLIPVLNIATDAMYRIAAKVRLFITKEGLEGGERIKENLLELCSTLSSLREANLSQYPLAALSRLPDDRNMAEKMLTSHLQTMSTTLVIADSPSEANRVVMWLGQFLMGEEVATSRIALSDKMWPYQPGISVQAVIRDSSGSIDLSSSKLLSSPRPLTLIDLTSNSVRQMAAMNVHQKHVCATFRMDLLALWHDLDHAPAPSHSLFESVDSACPLVKRFLHEWDRLASCDAGVREAYLDAFLRSLQYSALALVMWTRHEWCREKRSRDSKSLLQALSSTFQLEEPDLKVLFAQAERLEPGFVASLFDKPAKE